MSRPRCPKCNGLLKHEPAGIIGPERVHCILCSWQMVRATARIAPAPETVETVPVEPKPEPELIPETKEIPMTTTKTKRGHCPSCKRDDVLMPGPKCPHCYDRTKKGLDVITGKPIKLLRAHDLNPAPIAAVVPARRAAILAGDEPEISAGPAKTAAPPAAGFNLYAMAAIDEAWNAKRDVIISQLNAADKTAQKMRIAFYALASVSAMGFEA